jgi:hypothetical protein
MESSDLDLSFLLIVGSGLIHTSIWVVTLKFDGICLGIGKELIQPATVATLREN